MTDIHRRAFLSKVGSSTAGMMAAGAVAPKLSVAAPSETLTVGIIGCSRGKVLAREMAKLGIRIAYVCDVDDARAGALKKQYNVENAVSDFRRILDDPAVDAVAVATPDHWHGAAAIMACEAGKHVYVEKPCCHNIREGQLMVKAARRTGRVMQVGSQSRSTTVLANGIQQLREEAIGEVLMAKAWNSQRRQNIGHGKPSKPPAGFDYDTWVGPAPIRPYQENCHHYTWHWWYDFGTGDIGNDGIHELDIALWGLAPETMPTVVAGHGSKLYFDDDQQFPDTQYVTFEFPKTEKSKKQLLVYEQRIWSPYVQEGHENCTVFYGTKGYLVVAKIGGWQLFGEKNKLIREEQGKYSEAEHLTNFMDAIKTGKTPSADIAIGHQSATLGHLANILARTGRSTLQFDPDKQQIVGDPEANALLGRTYRKDHWSTSVL